MFFHQINEVLWGDVSISMLTLFRVATFEDWTEYQKENKNNDYVDMHA
jgi:voltage-gated sodium channel